MSGKHAQEDRASFFEPLLEILQKDRTGLNKILAAVAARRDPKVFEQQQQKQQQQGASTAANGPPRFIDDDRDIALYIERTKNKNVVAFKGQYNSSANGAALKEKEPIDAFWLDIDPEYMAANRKKGVASNRCELNIVDKKMAYGFAVKEPLPLVDALAKPGSSEAAQAPVISPEDPQVYPLTFVALEKRRLYLVLTKIILADGVTATYLPVVFVLLNGTTFAVLERIFVASTEPKHFYQLPTVQHIDLFGIDCRTGAEVTERIVNK